MKLFLLIALPLNVFAATLSVSSDISQIVSHDGAYEAKYSNATRNRFIVRHALGGEGYQSIQLEAYSPGREGREDTIIQSKTYEVPSLPKIKERIDKLAKKSTEATYGCCGVTDIKWNESGWSFTVKADNTFFKCKASGLDAKEPKVTCAE